MSCNFFLNILLKTACFCDVQLQNYGAVNIVPCLEHPVCPSSVRLYVCFVGFVTQKQNITRNFRKTEIGESRMVSLQILSNGKSHGYQKSKLKKIWKRIKSSFNKNNEGSDAGVYLSLGTVFQTVHTVRSYSRHLRHFERVRGFLQLTYVHYIDHLLIYSFVYLRCSNCENTPQ